MRTVVILLFDEVEILDATGPFEVFSVADRLRSRETLDGRSCFRACTVAQSRAVKARHGLNVVPDKLLSECETCDVLIVPGGVVDAARESSDLLEWVRRMADRSERVASVCTGSFILAEAGLLDRKRATTHWEDIEEFRRTFPRVQVITDVRWTEDGNIWTSAGISSGLDMSLQLVAGFEGMTLAQRTARQMEYAWNRNGQ